MCCLWVGLLALLAFSGQVLAAGGEDLLQPPRNLTLVSEDFKLFLTWQPAEDYPPGVSYTVKWRDPFHADWSTSPCMDISATSCDVTCVYPNPSNRFQLQVEALDGTGRTSNGTPSDLIDYEDLVELAPPVLQVRKAEGFLLVNTTFTYPSCVQSFFQDLAYNLEFWENGTQPKKLSNVMETEVNISTELFSRGNYCLRAQAFLPHRRNPSPFSKPVCGLLQAEEENWSWVVLLILLLLALPSGGAIIYFSWCRNATAKLKTPQVLDFSSYKGPKFLELGEKELIKGDVILLEKKPVMPEIRRRPAIQKYLPLTPSAEEEEEEEEDDDDDDDEDDSGSPMPYTELRSLKKDLNCQRVGVGQITLNPSFEPDSSQSSGGRLADVMVLKPFVATELVTGDFASELQDSRRTSLSASSSAGESLPFSVRCPATRGRESLNGGIDFSIHLSTLIQGEGFSLPSEAQCVAATDFPEGNWGNLEDSQIPLLRIQSHKDTCRILEEQIEVERGLGNASSGCGRRTKEMLLLKACSLEGAESCTQGGNRNLGAGSIPEPKVHGYQPRQTLYISKTGP